MRTTIDLPDDVHQNALAIARARHQTLSRTVAELLRTAMTPRATTPPVPIEVDTETGLPVVDIGHPITAEDVARLDDQ